MASQREANILQQNWERDQRALARAQRNQAPEPNPPSPPPAEQEEETPSEPGDAVEVVLQLLEELPAFGEEEDHLTLRTESETGEDVLLFPLTNSPPTPAGGDYFSRPLHNTPDTTDFRNRGPPGSGHRAFLANPFLNPPSSSSSSSGNNTPQRPPQRPLIQMAQNTESVVTKPLAFDGSLSSYPTWRWSLGLYMTFNSTKFQSEGLFKDNVDVGG